MCSVIIRILDFIIKLYDKIPSNCDQEMYQAKHFTVLPKKKLVTTLWWKNDRLVTLFQYFVPDSLPRSGLPFVSEA